MTHEKELWVFADRRNERHFTESLRILSLARRLGEALPAKTGAILAGSSQHNRKQADLLTGDEVPMDDTAKRLIAHGADHVYLFDDEVLAIARTDLFAPILSHAVTAKSPLLVLFPLSDFGRELAARTARLCNAGLIADCIDISLRDNRFIAACPSWGGEVLAEITYTENYRKPGFATVQPREQALYEVSGHQGILIPMALPAPSRADGITLIERSLEPASQKKLEDADIVVVGGAGLGSTEGFALVRELASALGGELGASRPPVLLHWTREDCLIGQTGKTIRPRLLISVGTSGAVQYTAGITESETIIAINRDPMAPIFELADIGIIADAASILPLLTAKIRQTVMRGLADSLQDARKEADGDRPATFGEKLRTLRETHGFTPESLAQATGQTPEAIAQFEDDETSPSVAFLLRLSQILKINPDTFLSNREKKEIRERRVQEFVTRTQNYSYRTLTPDGGQEHLRSFMVTIEPWQAHKPVAYKHEGEEFIYVMEGTLELTLGGKNHRLKPHESIRFNSEIPHRLKSISDETTRCLVVLYTP